MQNLKNFEGALKLIRIGMSSLEDAYESWRDRVFCGAEEFDDGTDLFHRTRLQEWVDEFKSFNEDVKTQCLDDRAEVIPDLQEIRNGYERIAAILDPWVPPYLSPNPTFRKTMISAADEKLIERVMNPGSCQVG